jgi:hypothetical protein
VLTQTNSVPVVNELEAFQPLLYFPGNYEQQCQNTETNITHFPGLQMDMQIPNLTTTDSF